MSWLSDDTLARLRSAASAPDLSGTRYRLLREVGRGGMSSVFLAEDPHLGRRVALKVLDVPDADGDLAQRLTREARILARLEHPGIAPVHDVGRLPDGRVFYTMKYVEGPRLDAFAAGVATLPERLRLFQRIVEAVAFAHDRGVLHRDLKPENIMVGPFGEVLVMDWGLAKVLDRQTGEEPAALAEADRVSTTGPVPYLDHGYVPGTPGSMGIEQARGTDSASPTGRVPHTDHGPVPGTPGSMGPEQARGADRASTTGRVPHTGHGSVLGTPGYMAPEQARGEVESLDARSDVYALGAVLLFLLTCRTPPGGVPRPLLAVCAKAMAEAKEDRYPDALALGAEVARYLDGRRVEAYPEGLLQKAARLYARHRVAFWLIVTYLVVRGFFLFFSRR